jgi:hypothetical protein
MKNTEDIQSFVMNRPNEKLDKHLEQYIRAAAIGLGLPYEFVWDTSAIGGVAQRFIIQKAARCFAARQDVLVNAFLSKLWRYAIARAISRKELPMNPGWQSVGWQTPRSITVDVGREATARRDDVKAGLMTLSDFFGEQGLDWKEAVAEIAAEREFAADLGVMIGVEQAQPQEEIISDIAQPQVVMPAAEFSQLIAKLDCGTGDGGFKPGNDCAKGGRESKGGKSSDRVRAWAQKKFSNPEHAKNFVKWFGNSKVVDENGEPLIVYHGTDKVFDEFRGHGYFAPERGYAEDYVDGGIVVEAYLSIKNPLVTSDHSYGMNSDRWDEVKADGYDGIAYLYEDKSVKAYIAFEPTQIKSASANTGSFDPKNPKMTHSVPASEDLKTELSERARKKKRIYKRKKPEDKQTA